MKEKDRIGCCLGSAVALLVAMAVVPVVTTAYVSWLDYNSDPEEGGFSGVFLSAGQQAELYFVCGVFVVLIVVAIAYVTTRR
jgi:ethanolamine utilization microcompartment shell protein EutL